MFKDGESVIKVYEGDKILGMTAEDINIEYHCTEENPDTLARIISQFSGETTLTGKLTLYYDEAIIKSYRIHYAETETYNSAELVSVNFLEDLIGIRY